MLIVIEVVVVLILSLSALLVTLVACNQMIRWHKTHLFAAWIEN